MNPLVLKVIEGNSELVGGVQRSIDDSRRKIVLRSHVGCRGDQGLTSKSQGVTVGRHPLRRPTRDVGPSLGAGGSANPSFGLLGARHRTPAEDCDGNQEPKAGTPRLGIKQVCSD